MSLFSNKPATFLKKCINYFKVVDELQTLIFSMLTKRDYFVNPYFYEHHTHKVRIKLMREMKNIRSVSDIDQQVMVMKLAHIYEAIFSLNTLKLRFSDQTTFEMCELEFKLLSKQLTAVLQHTNLLLKNQINKTKRIILEKIQTQDARKMLDKTAHAINQLTQAIDGLDELYRTTMQVVSPDPILFLFFLQDLMVLRDLLESFVLGILNE